MKKPAEPVHNETTDAIRSEGIPPDPPFAKGGATREFLPKSPPTSPPREEVGGGTLRQEPRGSSSLNPPQPPFCEGGSNEGVPSRPQAQSAEAIPPFEKGGQGGFSESDWQQLHARILGLEERALRKSYYPELRKKLLELERFRALLDCSTDLVFLAEYPSGKIIDANQATSRYLGYARHELLTFTLTDILLPFTPDELASLAAPVDRQNSRQETDAAQDPDTGDLNRHGRHGTTSDPPSIVHLRCRAGDSLPTEVTIQTTRLEDRQYAVVVGRDISERLKVAQALRESEQRFRDFADAAADWFWEMDTELRFSYISGRFHEVTGLSPNHLLGLRSQEFLARHMINTQRWNPYFADLEAHRPIHDLEFVWLRPDGTTRVVRTSGKPIFDGHGHFLGYRGTGRDITEQHRLADERQRLADDLNHQATHDALTGLVNRREFIARLERALISAREHHQTHTLCYMDVDQFKLINDTAGHLAGDELLKQISNRWMSEVGETHLLGRLGGDEFSLLLENCPLERAQHWVERLVKALRDFQFIWGGYRFEVSVSVGLVPITAQSQGAAQILAQADVACYTAKDLGRNRIHVYQREGEPARRYSEIQRVAELRQALAQDRFHLYCQPIVSLLDEKRRVTHYEILLRLIEKDNGIIQPGTFIPAAERYGLMTAIDRWVIHAALHQAAQVLGGGTAGASISINLSGNSLMDDDFARFLRHELIHSPLSPQRVCFEITETAAVGNLTQVVHLIKDIKKLGCQFALDDFGSGLCSFTYLKNMPVDYLKIDGSFVRNILREDEVDRAMVEAINQVGHIMGRKTIAEYAENEDILEQLRWLGVDYAQGYALGLPRPLSPWGGDTRESLVLTPPHGSDETVVPPAGAASSPLPPTASAANTARSLRLAQHPRHPLRRRR